MCRDLPPCLTVAGESTPPATGVNAQTAAAGRHGGMGCLGPVAIITIPLSTTYSGDQASDRSLGTACLRGSYVSSAKPCCGVAIVGHAASTQSGTLLPAARLCWVGMFGHTGCGSQVRWPDSSTTAAALTHPTALRISMRERVARTSSATHAASEHGAAWTSPQAGRSPPESETSGERRRGVLC